MVQKAKWVGGLAYWEIENAAYISVAFTWKLREALEMAFFAKSVGKNVMVGGPALFLEKMKTPFRRLKIEIGKSYPDAIRFHNPMATIASRGCPVGCGFCIVPKMEGKEFTLLPDFPVRPILCDNNLSALPADYQQFIIDRYSAAGVRLLDANSGFEPITFTPDVYNRWSPLLNAGGGPWRFAYDETKERGDVLRVMQMLKDEPPKRKQVYILIGNEPFDDCMRRIQETLEHGCEPYVQPLMKLVAREREPHIQFDWTKNKLKDVARWANRHIWRTAPFSEYNGSVKTRDSDHKTSNLIAVGY